MKYKIIQGFLEEKEIGEVILNDHIALIEIGEFKLMLQPIKRYGEICFQVVGLPKDKFYTIEEVAKGLQLNIQTVTKYIRDGKLGAIALGKGYRIPKDCLDKFIEERKT